MLKIALLAAASLAIAATPATAAPCRDAKGHFAKCTTMKTTTKTSTRCKDAKGRFAKCSAQGAASGIASVPSVTNLNAATAEELDAVPGLTGHGYEIVRYRGERGAFTELRQLEEVPGLAGKVNDETRSALCTE